MAPGAYRRLASTHPIRVAILTATLGLSVWMNLRSSAAQHRNPGLGYWLLLATAILALYGVANIWLVQLVCYRLWTHVAAHEFYGYHLAWWRSIWGVIFVPSGLALCGAIAMLWLHPRGVSSVLLWAALDLQIALYILTAAWWGPLMARLATREQGLLLPNYRMLMSTHWLRVAIVTAFGLLLFAMLAEARP